MPRGETIKEKVNKEIFTNIVHQCGSSINKLGECEAIECTERTIRRSLNKGGITPRYLEQIAKYLNVDTRLLSGELHQQASKYEDEFFREMYLSQLTISNYPYYRKRRADLSKEPIEDLLERILSLFEISFDQYERMDFEAKYLFQHDLLEVLVPIVRKHFQVDAYGRKNMPDLEKIIYDLENFRENYYLQMYANEKLREKYLKHPPRGKTKSDIQKMSAEDLIGLDMSNQ